MPNYEADGEGWGAQIGGREGSDFFDFPDGSEGEGEATGSPIDRDEGQESFSER